MEDKKLDKKPAKSTPASRDALSKHADDDLSSEKSRIMSPEPVRIIGGTAPSDLSSQQRGSHPGLAAEPMPMPNVSITLHQHPSMTMMSSSERGDSSSDANPVSPRGSLSASENSGNSFSRAAHIVLNEYRSSLAGVEPVTGSAFVESQPRGVTMFQPSQPNSPPPAARASLSCHDGSSDTDSVDSSASQMGGDDGPIVIHDQLIAPSENAIESPVNDEENQVSGATVGLDQDQIDARSTIEDDQRINLGQHSADAQEESHSIDQIQEQAHQGERHSDNNEEEQLSRSQHSTDLDPEENAVDSQSIAEDPTPLSANGVPVARPIENDEHLDRSYISYSMRSGDPLDFLQDDPGDDFSVESVLNGEVVAVAGSVGDDSQRSATNNAGDIESAVGTDADADQITEGHGSSNPQHSREQESDSPKGECFSRTSCGWPVKRIACFIFIALIPLVMITGISITKSRRESGETDVFRAELLPTPPPTKSPSISPTPAPTWYLEVPEDYPHREVTIRLLEPILAYDERKLYNVRGKPQNLALNWLDDSSWMLENSNFTLRKWYHAAEGDEMNITLPLDAEERLIQRYALAVMFYSMKGGGGGWIDNFQFLTNIHECEWHSWAKNQSGVTGCDKMRRVTAIDIQNNGLSGSLPSEIRGLPYLRKLLLGHNSIGGTIPDELGGLVDLRVIDAGVNELTGSLPSSLGNLTLLGSMDFATNFLEGSVPSEVKNMASLDHLWLHENDFTSGVDHFCSNGMEFGTFYSDCLSRYFPSVIQEVECSCCTVCCGDAVLGDESCVPRVSFEMDMFP